MYILETTPNGNTGLWKVVEDGLYCDSVVPRFALWSWDEIERDKFDCTHNHTWDCLTDSEAILEML